VSLTTYPTGSSALPFERKQFHRPQTRPSRKIQSAPESLESETIAPSSNHHAHEAGFSERGTASRSYLAWDEGRHGIFSSSRSRAESHCANLTWTATARRTSLSTAEKIRQSTATHFRITIFGKRRVSGRELPLECSAKTSLLNAPAKNRRSKTQSVSAIGFPLVSAEVIVTQRGSPVTNGREIPNGRHGEALSRKPTDRLLSRSHPRGEVGTDDKIKRLRRTQTRSQFPRSRASMFAKRYSPEDARFNPASTPGRGVAGELERLLPRTAAKDAR